MAPKAPSENLPKRLPIFHLAIPVKDIPSTLNFYQQQLQLPIELIEAERCIINFFGHQVVAHVSEEDVPQSVAMYPRHFGVIVERMEDFETLLENAKASGAHFFKEPFTRFEHSDRAHRTFFLLDPSNNLIEFKWYANPTLIHKK